MAANVDSQLADAFFRLSLIALNEKPNVSAVVSPFSIAMALATVNVGANEVTSREISDHVFAGIPKDQVASWFRKFLVGDNGEPLWSGEYSPISIASAIYLQQTLRPLESFVTEVGENFDCPVKSVDFAREPQAQKDAINAFVEEATRGHIRGMLSDTDMLNVRLVAVNAMYIQPNFVEEFDKADTKEAPFHNEDGSIKQVQMMNGRKKGYFYETDRYAYAQIRFMDRRSGKENEKFNFFFIVPKTDDLSALKESFSSGNSSFSATTGGAAFSTNIQIQALPKFKIDAYYRFKEILERLGINQGASFSGIVEEASLYVDAVLHKAVFELDEKGVTAAADSACMMPMRSYKPRNIRADKPFLYGVTFNGAPLFVGQFY